VFARFDNSAETAHQVQVMPEEQPEAVLASHDLPVLPPEVWGTIARATLAAADSSICEWLRLRAVSRAMRNGLKGACRFALHLSRDPEVGDHQQSCLMSPVLHASLELSSELYTLNLCEAQPLRTLRR